MFGKGYPAGAAVKDRVGARRGMHRSLLRAGSVVSLVAVLVASAALAGAAPTSPRIDSGVRTLNQPWASNNTGGVAVVFASPFPEVTLIQNANASVAADLQIDGILELAAGASQHPHVVAVALPLSISHFNGTPPGNRPAPWAFNLTATLAVYPTDLPLWNGTPAAPPSPLGPPTGDATLTVGYATESQSDGTGQVNVAWSVSGWPWAASGNIIAIESHFSMAPAANLWTCSGSSTLTQTACPGQKVSVGSSNTILWNPGIVGIEEDNATGPTAAVAWSPTLTLTGPVNGSARVTPGIDATSPGSVEFVLGGVAGGASSVSGTMSVALSAPTSGLTGVPPLGAVTATPLLYVASAGAFAAFAVAGIWWYRRREARAEDEL